MQDPPSTFSRCWPSGVKTVSMPMVPVTVSDMGVRIAGEPRERGDHAPLAATFAQVSFSVTVRLKTGRSGVES